MDTRGAIDLSTLRSKSDPDSASKVPGYSGLDRPIWPRIAIGGMLILAGVMAFVYSSIAFRDGSQGEFSIPSQNGSIRVIMPSTAVSITGAISFIGSASYYLNDGRVYPMAVQMDLKFSSLDSTDLTQICLQLTEDATPTTMPPDPDLSPPGHIKVEGREVDSATVFSFFQATNQDRRHQLVFLEPPPNSFTTFSHGSIIKGGAISGWLDSRQRSSLTVRLFLRMSGTFATRDGVRTTLVPPSVLSAVADRDLFREFVQTKGQPATTVHISQYPAQVTNQDLTEELHFDELSALESKPPTVPPEYRLDVYPPGMRDPTHLSWPASGSGIVSIIDRRGEKQASQDLFFAGIGYGASVALAPLGVQLMPWLAIARTLRRSRARSKWTTRLRRDHTVKRQQLDKTG